MTPRPPGAEPSLVLIVDDNEKNRRLAGDVLRAAGFRTRETGSGAEGIALARELLPDVILLDLRLPDLDGRDVARELGDAPLTAGIAVVAFSALRFDGDEDWLRDAGFAGHVEKPIDIRRFADQVRGYCRRVGR